jgi:magnesium transporter
VIEFHRAVYPLLMPLESMERGNYVQIGDQLARYFRDVLGVQQNTVIRGISAWAAIIAVPTFLASIWGMNFTHMPELDETWGYPLALLLMALAVGGLYRFFRRIEWL